VHIDTEPDAVRPQAVLRDLVAVSALSAAWIGKEPPAIATALADALVDLLQLDFAFVHLSNRGGTEAVDATRGNALPRLSDWLASHGSPANPLRPAEIIPDVGGDSGPCLVVPVGFDGDAGVVAAACGRDGFPTAIDELLISLAANHAAVAFQSARLIEERQRAEGALRQARDDLELKVAERTAQLGQLAGEQAALQHVAVLVAQQPSPDEVFTAVTEAVGPLLGADLAAMHVFPGDGTATVVACWSAAGPKLPVGTRLPLDGDSTAARIFRTSAPARLDSYAGVGGDTADVARGLRLRSTVGAPIVVDGKLWGALMAAVRGDDPLPGDAETRIAAFTELVATAISNAQARRDMHWLADGQAALRRVATLVAEGAPQEQVFACVAREAAHVLQAPVVTIDRYDSDSFSTVVASLGEPDFPVGSRWPLDGPTLGATVFSTGQPARVDDYADLESTAAAVMRASSMRSAVGVPILVDGRPWGVICVGARDPTLLGDDFEARLVDFTKLLAAAIVRAESREALARVADEQAALRRMATLVARGAPADDVFSAVVREVGGSNRTACAPPWRHGARPTSLSRPAGRGTRRGTTSRGWSYGRAGPLDSTTSRMPRGQSVSMPGSRATRRPSGARSPFKAGFGVS